MRITVQRLKRVGGGAAVSCAAVSYAAASCDMCNSAQCSEGKVIPKFLVLRVLVEHVLGVMGGISSSNGRPT